MARLVVLSFEDNEEAEAFIKNENQTPEAVWDLKVEGAFAMPTQFCPSSGSGGCSPSKRVRGWVRGKKYGWWVCAICKKPSGFSGTGSKELWRRVVAQGVNLLKEITEQDIATIHDEGWGAAGR